MDMSKEMDDALQSGDPDEIASAQVGVGTPPGQTPFTGTHSRTEAAASTAGGRFDAEEATWGRDDHVAGQVETGQPVDNVGSPEGDLPTEATAEFPGDDPREEPGIFDKNGGRGEPGS